ncbi:insulinase family protein [Candidatus Wolfebacteria bacterium]|nr:insulinase family protein [Candidatus Wolfebacteria bacterium]
MAFYNKQFQSFQLKNGLNIITRQDNNSDIATLSFRIKAGSRYEKENELGYAHLLEHMLLKGTKNFPSPFEIGYAVDRAGAYLNASTGQELSSVYIQVAKEKWQEMFKLLCDIISNPIFQKEIFENEKKVIFQEIKKTNDNPNKYLWIKTIKNIFKNHPLSHHPLGDEEIIKKAVVENLIDYRERLFIPNNMVLIANGAIDNEELIRITEQEFSVQDNIQQKSGQFDYSVPQINKGEGFEYFNSSQSYFNFNFVSARADLKDYLALQLISIFLGSLKTSILYQELRQKMGLVYNVNAYNTGYQDANLFYIETSSNYPDKVIPIVIEKLLNFEKYFSESLLKEYQEQYVNSLIRKLSDPFNEIKFLSEYWFLYNGINQLSDLINIINSIKYEDLFRIKNQYLNENNLFIMKIGKDNPQIPA